jgi:hypothetical protein
MSLLGVGTAIKLIHLGEHNLKESADLELPNGGNDIKCEIWDVSYWVQRAALWQCVGFQRRSGKALTTSFPQTPVYTQSGAVATGAGTIPLDDTIPQITEGNEFLTATFTPTSATNLLKIDVVMNTSLDQADSQSFALFQDALSDALAAVNIRAPNAGHMANAKFTYFMIAGSTSSITYRVRAGGTSGTITFNGIAGSIIFGGVMSSSITITEYTV